MLHLCDIETSKSAAKRRCFYISTCKCAWRYSGVLLFGDLKAQKCPEHAMFFSILTWKCASPYSGVEIFQSPTSKSAPPLRCFVHFHLQMRFSLQRRASFPHLNFEKWFGTVIFFLHFDLQMCFAPQRRAIFPHPNFQKVLRRRRVLYIFTSNVLRATAACHFSCLLWAATSAPAALASLLFDPANPQIIEKTQHFATSLTFRACGSSFYWFRAIAASFFWFYFSSLLFIFWLCFSALLFQLSILSEVRLLNFLWQSTTPVLHCTTKYYSVLQSTSSTAQGGGGSFKNRKL